ncbi:cation diffusion facilitator family transporter [Rugosimonospora africana]|uniref:Cation efflux system protein n=1 Tax=Rugosimonospora africana TaxID=556532 RepID=A0A8J3VTH5_9ACTN|nr:cation diffusion facilitator family transporter [Rugosimonospora africana]GIH18084.1 cation efflux system protein [Rugosimonospora africana]
MNSEHSHHDDHHGHSSGREGSHHAHDHDAHDGHGHDHRHGHDHPPDGGLGALWHKARHVVTPHSHDAADKVDSAMEASRDGLRALWISLAVLGGTAVLQAVITALSGSVALLGDTLHNVADALTAVPLGIAFILGRRVATRRYTYGFGRAEDLAGIAIVTVIAASSALAGFEAIRRLLYPATVSHLPYVAAAAAIGFAGNEIVARYRIGVGRRIGSAALVADGLHARTDGFTSLAVLLGAGGVAIGWRWADPVVGLLITVAILFVLNGAAREVYRRLMDAVDPALVDTVEATLRETSGVIGVGAVHLRWIGHQLRAECEIIVDADLTVARAHAIAVDAEHRLIHAVPRLTAALVHADPYGQDQVQHARLDHHRDAATAG